MKQLLLFLLLVAGCSQQEHLPDAALPLTEAASAAEPEYLSAEMSIHGFPREVIFGLCRQIPDDVDASNMYGWMLNEYFDIQESFGKHEQRNHEQGTTDPYKSHLRKPTVGYTGEVWSDGERVRFAIRKNLPAITGEPVVETFFRTREDMERRLNQWKVEN